MTEQEERRFLLDHKELYHAFTAGAVCGLYTVDSAVFNWDYHGMALFPYSDVPQKLNDLYDARDSWITEGYGDKIPEWLIKEENEQLEKFMEGYDKSVDI